MLQNQNWSLGTLKNRKSRVEKQNFSATPTILRAKSPGTPLNTGGLGVVGVAKHPPQHPPNTHHFCSLPAQGARWVFGGSYGGSYGGSLARFYDCNLLVYSVLYNLQLQKWWVLLRKKVKKSRGKRVRKTKA